MAAISRRPRLPLYAALTASVVLAACSLMKTEQVPEGTASAGATPEMLAERAELYARLRTAVAALPERHRLIVRLVELEGFSTAEVAHMLDLSPSTVRWYLHEARHRLRCVLAPMHGGVHAV